MNVDFENLEKRKKIVVICLSVALIFITLIAGFFIIKNNKEDSFENNDLGGEIEEVINNEVIVNENSYLFNKKSGQITENILLFVVTGILLFFWENDKLSGKIVDINIKDCPSVILYGVGKDINGKDVNIGVGTGIFEKANWFGLSTLASFIVITLLVEFIFNHLLIGSIAHLFSKDKNKKYFHTLKKSWKKRKQLLFSSLKIKNSFVAFCYLLYGFVIAMFARALLNRCKICCCRENGEIIHDHGKTCCCGFGEVKKKSDLPLDMSSSEAPKLNLDKSGKVDIDVGMETKLNEFYQNESQNNINNPLYQSDRGASESSVPSLFGIPHGPAVNDSNIPSLYGPHGMIAYDQNNPSLFGIPHGPTVEIPAHGPAVYGPHGPTVEIPPAHGPNSSPLFGGPHLPFKAKPMFEPYNPQNQSNELPGTETINNSAIKDGQDKPETDEKK